MPRLLSFRMALLGALGSVLGALLLGAFALAAPAMNRAASVYHHPAARIPLAVGQGTVSAFDPDGGQAVTFAGAGTPAALRVPGKWTWNPQPTPRGLLAAQLDFARCRVALWNLSTGQAGAALQGDFRRTFGCGRDGTEFMFNSAFTPDGRFFLAQDDRRLSRWDARTGRLLNTRAGSWASLNLSPDGREVALLGMDHRLEVWAADLTRRLKTTPAQPASCLSAMGAQVAWSRDSRRLAFACTRELRVWNVAAGGLQPYRRTGPVEQADPPVFSPDGRFLVAGEAQHGVAVWGVGRPEVLARTAPLDPGVQVTDVAVTNSNVVLAALSDGHLLRLDLERPTTPLPPVRVYGSAGSGGWPSLTVNPQGTWAAMTDGRGAVTVFPVPLPDDWSP